MAATPEGRVKRRVRKLLDRYEGLYQFWPVPTGLGSTTLDVLGCYRGRFFAIETKADKRVPTERQLVTMAQMRAAGAEVFVVTGDRDEAIFELKVWLDAVERETVERMHDRGSA